MPPHPIARAVRKRHHRRFHRPVPTPSARLRRLTPRSGRVIALRASFDISQSRPA